MNRFGSFSKSGRTAVISTINGDSNIAFYRELAKQDMTAEQIPVMAFSIGEEELRTLDTSALAGHFAAWNYFMSIDSPENQRFREQWAEYSKAKAAGRSGTSLDHRPDGGHPYRYPSLEAGRRAGRLVCTRKGAGRPWGASPCAPQAAWRSTWTSRTTTCTNRCSLAESGRTVSLT